MDASNTLPYHLPAQAVWFITGCSSGIGLALAQQVAAHATNRLVATARKLSSLSAIPDGPNVLKLPLDVTSQASVDSAVTAALEKFGRLDVVVNNAGYSLMGDTENATEAQEQRLLDTLFWGTVRLMKHAIPTMRDINPRSGPVGGVVLNVSSMGGFVGYPGNAFYHAGKFAVEGFTEAVAKEMRPEWNIHFCLIEPGGVKTNYATSSMDHIAPHPAYAAPDTPARILEAYMGRAENRETWSSAERVAAAMVEVVSRGRRIPIRVPLGPDAWSVIKAEAQQVDKELDELKELSFKVGDPKQLESITFLQKTKD